MYAYAYAYAYDNEKSKSEDMPGRRATTIITEDSPREADVGRTLTAREALAPQAACNVVGGNCRGWGGNWRGVFGLDGGTARRRQAALSPSWMHQAAR